VLYENGQWLGRMKTYYQIEISLHILLSVASLLISISLFKTQIFLGIVFSIISLYFVIISFLVVIKINIYDNYIIAYKLLNKKNIPFCNIKNITIEKRHFIGEGRYSTRKALVVSYIEDSGYGDELILSYNDDMYNQLKNSTQVKITN